MRLGGLQKCSLIDFPGKITAILFTVGCNFRCPYCHNPELVDETSEIISVDNVFAFLTRRREILDAVTITGGEPTIQTDLVPFIRKVKEMGFLVKLDTNGTHPEVIELVQEEKLVDYIAMDIKAPLGRYASSVARPVDEVQIKKSIQLLIKGNIPYEFRTTVVKSLLAYDDLHEIGKTIKNAERYYLQKFVPTKPLNPAFVRKTTYTDTEFSEMQRFMETYVKLCGIR